MWFVCSEKMSETEREAYFKQKKEKQKTRMKEKMKQKMKEMRRVRCLQQRSFDVLCAKNLESQYALNPVEEMSPIFPWKQFKFQC